MYTYQTKIKLHETDAAGLLFFSNQFKLVHDAYEELLETIGLGFAELIRNKDYFLPIVHAEADFKLPLFVDDERVSACHLYLMRIKGFTEAQRDKMILLISEEGVGVNVHYIPMPMLTLFKSRRYRVKNYPMAYQLYQNEITLPVYNGLTEEQLEYVVATVVKAYESIIQESPPRRKKCRPVVQAVEMLPFRHSAKPNLSVVQLKQKRSKHSNSEQLVSQRLNRTKRDPRLPKSKKF